MLIRTESCDVETNRDAFGCWLSGFTDGEGSFCLNWNRRGETGSARFMIKLRRDDRAILEEIRLFWACGQVEDIARKPRGNGRPQTDFRVLRLRELASIVIPHFERYPLRAKKAADFVIWREAVAMLRRVAAKPRRKRPGRTGSLPTWTDADKAEFQRFRAALTEARRYKLAVNPIAASPLPVPTDDQKMLW